MSDSISIPKLASRRPALTLVLASLGVLMTALDTLVVTTALPVLRVDLHAGLSGLEWTVNAYNLSFACLLLTGAALGDRFGRRRMFVLGLSVFTAASAAAALSGTVQVLIGARVLQGAGAAVVMPLSLTLITEAFPAERRGAAIGMWGGIVGLAVAAGPVVGGSVVAGLDWHWMFWLNVPVGLVVVPLAGRHLTESFGPRLAPRPGGLGAGRHWCARYGPGSGASRQCRVGQRRGRRGPRGGSAGGGGLRRLGKANRQPHAPSRAVPLQDFRRRQRRQLLHVRRSVRCPVPHVPAATDRPRLLPLEAGLRLLPWTRRRCSSPRWPVRSPSATATAPS